MRYTTRIATSKDAQDVCILLRRSIRELCVADHGNDEKILSKWLEGKTPKNMEKWIASGDSKTIVAVDGEGIAGVGCIGADGSIHLCYVAPNHIGKGAGAALMGAMLNIAKRQCNAIVQLTSTKTAKPFYEHHGFVSGTQTVLCFGIPGYPMSRAVEI